MKSLWKLNGYEITDLLNKKEVSATEICDNLIEHIEKINPKINAIVIETFDDAKKQAKFLDKKINFQELTRLINRISNLKEFQKFKKIKPRNIKQIYNLRDYVHLKLNALGI